MPREVKQHVYVSGLPIGLIDETRDAETRQVPPPVLCAWVARTAPVGVLVLATPMLSWVNPRRLRQRMGDGWRRKTLMLYNGTGTGLSRRVARQLGVKLALADDMQHAIEELVTTPAPRPRLDEWFFGDVPDDSRIVAVLDVLVDRRPRNVRVWAAECALEPEELRELLHEFGLPAPLTVLRAMRRWYNQACKELGWTWNQRADYLSMADGATLRSALAAGERALRKVGWLRPFGMD